MLFKFNKKNKNNISGIISSRSEDKSFGVLSKYNNSIIIWMVVIIIVLSISYAVLIKWRDASAVNIERILEEQEKSLSIITDNENYYLIVSFRNKLEGLKAVSEKNKQAFFIDHSPLPVIGIFNQTLHKGVKLTNINIDFNIIEEGSSGKYYNLEINAIAQAVNGKDFIQVVGEQELIWSGEDESGEYNNFAWLNLKEFNTSYEIEEEGISINASFQINLPKLESFIKSQEQNVQSQIINNDINPDVFYNINNDTIINTPIRSGDVLPNPLPPVPE